MKKIAAAAVLVLAACAFSAAQTYLLVTEEYPPYEYLDGGKPAGMDVEMLRAAAARAGVSVEFRFVPWVRAEAMAKGGQADGIFSLFRTKEREAFLLYAATPLGSERNAVFANSGFKGEPTRLADLKGLRIGSVTGNSYGPLFDSFSDYLKDENADVETMLRKLAGNRTPLGVVNQVVGRHLIKRLGLSGLRILPIDLGEEPLFVGFAKASPKGAEAHARLSAALSELEASGELKAIRDKYLK